MKSSPDGDEMMAGYKLINEEHGDPAFPSIAYTPTSDMSLFCWMHPNRAEGPRYTKVDWENATPEDMEKWRQEFIRLGL